jgi:polyhydroxyalkanoate synthesis repressor PhaR
MVAAPSTCGALWVHLIKRYANRKLYDTSQSRYVTLDDVAGMIKDGDEIQIIDNKTKEDLTAVTMAQVLVEEEKRARRNGKLPALRGLIRDKGEQLSRAITEPVQTLRTNVEESVSKLIRTGEERAAETRADFEAWWGHNHSALEELHRRVDERVRSAVTSLDIIERMRADIRRLEIRVAELEAGDGVDPEA